MKIHSYLKPVLIILILILSITGCTSNGSNSNTFDITVRIVDVMDKGIPQATVKIKKDNGDTVVAKTDENGQFSKTGLKGEVEITVAKEEYNFDNPTRTVSSSIYLKFKGKLKVKISDKAQVLDDDIENKIVEVNENEVIFKGFNCMINELTKGDIIIADPIENIAPNGIFRKIEGKTTSGTQIIFTTSQATLKDVIKQGGFSQVKELKYEDVETQSLNQTNKKIQLQASPSSAHEFRVNITKEIEIADGVTISGSLDFNLNLKLEGTFKYCILQGIRFEEIITQESGLNITYGKGIKIEKEKEIYEKTLPRVKFTIGPVPVWITPQFNLVVGVDGEVSTELTTEVTAVKEITAGFEYDTDEGFQKIFEQTNDYRREEQILEGSSNIHGYFGPKMEFDFYEVTGPTTGLYPYLDFIGEVTTDLSYLDMGWDLKGGLQGQIGAQIEFMGIDAEASYNLDLLPRMIAEGVMLKTDTLGKGTVQKEPDQLLYYVPVWKGEDAEIKITAQPDTGYRFDHWETGYNNIGSENPYNIKIDKPTLVTAVFEETPPKNHTLTIDTSGEGTVTPPEGSHEYNEGAEVTLEANPADGWEFVEWQGDISDTNSTTTLTMNRDKNVTAVFEETPPKNHTLTIDTSGEGTVTPPEGSHEYNEGAEVTLEANPADGWEFVEWTGDVSSTNPITTVIMNEDKNITVHFEEKSANSSPTINNLSKNTSGLQATITASVSDNDNNLSDVVIEWGDSNTTNITSGFDNINESHIYTSGGSYTVNVTATDSQGATVSVSLTVSVSETNETPTIEVSANTNNLTATVSGKITDSDGSVSSAVINWGDGNTTTISSGYDSISESHSYNNGGSYTIEITATDNDGTSSSKEINVSLEEINAFFEVNIDEYASDKEGKPGEPFTIYVDVENTGNIEDTQEISFNIEYEYEAGYLSREVTLKSGEAATIEFSNTVPEDAGPGEREITVSSEDNSDSYTVTILKKELTFTNLEPAVIEETDAPFQASLSASGIGFNEVEKIEYYWSGAASGSAVWEKGDYEWNYVTKYSDTSMTFEPVIIEEDPTWSGTCEWEVILVDTNGNKASETFTVIYEP